MCHDPRFEIATDQAQQSFIFHFPRNPGHQSIVVNPVKERIQVNLDHPPITLLNDGPGNPNRLLGALIRPKPIRNWHERSEERRVGKEGTTSTTAPDA